MQPQGYFFTPYYNMSVLFLTFAATNLNEMVTELIVVWIVGVVSFFVLWAILLKVIKRISEKRHEEDTAEAASVKNDISGEIS